MQRIRIVELPAVRAACSGPLTDEARFARFNDWFSRYHAAQPCELYPRDFMWYNERLGAQEWFYALPAGADERDTEGFPVVTLPHGLFAVAPCFTRKTKTPAGVLFRQAFFLMRGITTTLPCAFARHFPSIPRIIPSLQSADTGPRSTRPPGSAAPARRCGTSDSAPDAPRRSRTA